MVQFASSIFIPQLIDWYDKLIINLNEDYRAHLAVHVPGGDENTDGAIGEVAVQLRCPEEAVQAPKQVVPEREISWQIQQNLLMQWNEWMWTDKYK